MIPDGTSPATFRLAALDGMGVRVWYGILDAGPATTSYLSALLSPDELARAARFRRAVDRERYVVAHAQLRILLGRDLERDPARLRFRHGPHGKPALADAPLEFSMSRSGSIGVYAFAKGCRVGVDVERIRPGFGDVASQLSRAEANRIAALLPSERDEALFRLWTLKEAWVKGTGEGLSRPLDSFTIVPTGTDAAEVRGERCAWTLRSFAPIEGFVAGVAVDHGAAG